MSTEAELRAQICRFGKRLHERNLIAGSDGNLSVRLDANTFLVTPGGACKGELEPEQLVVADSEGNKIGGQGEVSSEFPTHLAAYGQRPEINAVVHAHPPNAVALTLAGIRLVEPVLPELVYALGEVPTAPYATPGTAEGADVVRPLIADHDAILLDRHGALCVGLKLSEAYYRLEKLEHAAMIILSAHSIGQVSALNADQIARLEKARRGAN